MMLVSMDMDTLIYASKHFCLQPPGVISEIYVIWKYRQTWICTMSLYDVMKYWSTKRLRNDHIGTISCSFSVSWVCPFGHSRRNNH